ncbi:MAG: VWA domain-containing protein [Pseudomonas marincola]
MAKNLDKQNDEASGSDVEAFLNKVRLTPKTASGSASGRLIFAIDATASRQPTWDNACHIQREMFDETSTIGTLSLQIAFFRGFNEFQATPWTTNSKSLTGPMSRVSCLGGHTQIEKVLSHTLKQASDKPVNALVYVGDCMEESADALCHLAGQMGVQGIPAFIFQEGRDPTAENCFRQMTKLSGGAFFRFDTNSASTLKTLLKAVAIYAVGGQKALKKYGNKMGGETLLLARQIK